MNVAVGHLFADRDKRRAGRTLYVTEIRFSAKRGCDVAVCIDAPGKQSGWAEVPVANLAGRGYRLVTSDAPQPPVPTPAACRIEDCDEGAVGQGMCARHYTRKRRHGDPHVLTKAHKNTAAVFWSRVEKSNGCWLWTGRLNADGYGIFKIDSRSRFAHRFAYEQTVGPVPNGLELDHLCRNRRCVNPACLEPVTHAENVRRGDAAIRVSKSHCVNGHEFTEANTYLTKKGFLQCITCRRASDQRYRGRLHQARDAA